MPRACANWLREYSQYTRASEAPDIFHFWTGVATIAGALRRRVWIDQRHFQWTPNFYIFLVAPPGVASKSTTANIGISLLSQIEGIFFGPQSITWQALITALSEAHEMVEMPDGLLYPMSCLTISAGELGTLFNPQDRELVDVLVDLWDSRIGSFRKSTKTQGNDAVENPWLNIIGCTTPAWIAGNVPEYLIGGGFTSRSVFVYAESKRRLVAYPEDEIDEADLAYHQQRLLNDLRMIAEMRGKFMLTADAKQWGKEWYERHWTKRPEHMASERYGGYIARKQTHIHKLAMVLAAADREGLHITKQDLVLAEKFITGLEVDMAKVFKSVGLQEDSVKLREILAHVRAYQKISRRALWRELMYHFSSSEEFDSAIQSCINAGYVKQVSSGSDIILYAVDEEVPGAQTTAAV